jgi:UDP-2,3-diacylglucosamine pyrophosphatase LpxH
MNFNGFLIVSDVHYGGFSAKKDAEIFADFTAVLSHFSKHEQNACIINGDLFDYWMEYPDATVPEYGLPVLETVRRHFGDRCIFIPGNHDVWEYGFFGRYGIKHQKNPFQFAFAGYAVACFHGDGHEGGPLSFPLPLLHKTIRKPGFVKAYQKWFPPRVGWFIMRWFSRLNNLKEWLKFNKKDRIAARFSEKPQLGEEKHLLFAGHEHLAGLHPQKKSCYINTGNFSAERTFAYLCANELLLMRWNAQRNSPETLQRLELNERRFTQ